MVSFKVSLCLGGRVRVVAVLDMVVVVLKMVYGWKCVVHEWKSGRE